MGLARLSQKNESVAPGDYVSEIAPLHRLFLRADRLVELELSLVADPHDDGALYGIAFITSERSAGSPR
jgi:hypothetical protein